MIHIVTKLDELTSNSSGDIALNLFETSSVLDLIVNVTHNQSQQRLYPDAYHDQLLRHLDACVESYCLETK